jgi:hypothetical protein
MSNKRSLGRLGKPYLATVLSVVFSLALAGPAMAQSETEQIEEIEAKVVELRGLEVKTPITVTYKTREELREGVIADFTDDYPEVDAARDQRTMVAFGIIEPGTDIRDLYSELYGGQVAGYYDPETGELVVVLDGDGSEGELTASEEFTLAHEITHALQDQHYDIDAGVFDTEDATDDVSLAATALIEGDATLLQGLYLQADPRFARDLFAEYDEMEEDDSLDDFPPVVVALLLFPYNQGFEFAEELYDEGGYELIDQAFSEPPTTTEQILHPEKYLEGEVGEEVTVIDPGATLGGEWATTDLNAFGEYIISSLLVSENVDSGDAEDAAEGWNGDSYTVAGLGDESAVVWASSWDSDDDAEEFAQTLNQRESDRLGEDAEEADGTWTIAASDQVVLVHLDGSDVIYAQAPDEAGARTLLEAQLAG